MENVHFTFPEQAKSTLQDIRLELRSNERLLITGPSGSGKSTLLHILAGLYDVQGGTISYNGLPKGNLEPDSLRSVVGDYLTQEQLFEGSVLENITMGRESATFDRVKWAVENLGLSKFIENLPNGYEALIDPQGKKLPLSTTQKILLARSIVDQPRLLLLEDAFVHLEEQERNSIIDFLIGPGVPWTLAVVSTNPYLAERADTIIVLEEGRITQRGTYFELKNNPNTNISPSTDA